MQPKILAELTQLKLSSKDVSPIIGQRWKEEDESVKSKYRKLAEDAKREHALAYPDYKYR
jgi:hypothetical protein